MADHESPDRDLPPPCSRSHRPSGRRCSGAGAILEAALVWAVMHRGTVRRRADRRAGFGESRSHWPARAHHRPGVARWSSARFGMFRSPRARSSGTPGAGATAAVDLQRVRAGEVPSGRPAAAQLTTTPPLAGAELVDRQLAATVDKIGWAAIGRLVDRAGARSTRGCREARPRPPTGAASTGQAREATHHGIAYVEGRRLGTPSISRIAIREAPRRSRHSGPRALDVRRSIAAGELARRQPAFDLDAEAGSAGQSAASVVKPRQVVIDVHLFDAAISATRRYRRVRYVAHRVD